MIRDIVVPITNTDGDTHAVAAVIGLATRENAHLVLLEFVNLRLPPTDAAFAIDDRYDAYWVRAETDAAAWRKRLAKESISSEVRVIESARSFAPDLAAQHGRCADLTVMTAATGAGRCASVIRDFFAAALLETGRPVLVVPSSFTGSLPAKHAVVAWRPTREATRALHDAMPLLRAAETVDVLEVYPPGDMESDGAQAGVDIATHLARHGLKVRVVIHQRHGESAASALINHAESSGAGLLVAGGYGHSRSREWALGGVTRELLRQTSLPILFSH